MKSIITFVLVALSIFTVIIILIMPPRYELSRGEQLVNSVLAKTAKIIKNKFDLRPSGEGAAMPGGPIQEVTLCFDTKHPYTKEQLRDLLIKSSAELLRQVNENKEIQEFLNEPFTIKNIEIIICNRDEKGYCLNDPQISFGDISQGRLNYSTIDPEDSFKYKNEYVESYEEAIKALSTHEDGERGAIPIKPGS